MVANAKSRNSRGVSGKNIDSGTMDTAKRDERVIMGRIRGAHGVRGLLRVQPFSAERDTLLTFGNWMLGGGDDWRDIALVSGHAHGSELLVKLDGVEDRDRYWMLAPENEARFRERVRRSLDHQWLDRNPGLLGNLEGAGLEASHAPRGRTRALRKHHDRITAGDRLLAMPKHLQDARLVATAQLDVAVE